MTGLFWQLPTDHLKGCEVDGVPLTCHIQNGGNEVRGMWATTHTLGQGDEFLDPCKTACELERLTGCGRLCPCVLGRWKGGGT
jgi:hypothetical protein